MFFVVPASTFPLYYPNISVHNKSKKVVHSSRDSPLHKFKLPRHNVPINYSKKMIVLKATDIEPYKLPPRTSKNTEAKNTKSVAVETTPSRGM